jgi:hypothetical protein
MILILHLVLKRGDLMHNSAKYQVLNLKDFRDRIKNKRTESELLYEFVTLLALSGFYKFNMTDNDLEKISAISYRSLNYHQKQLISAREFISNSVQLLKRVELEMIKREKNRS